RCTVLSLPPLPRGARGDEHDQQAKNQVHEAPLPGNPVHEASRYLFFLVRLSSLRASDGTEGQAAGRLQRLGIRRLARWFLSAGHAAARLPEILVERVGLRRGRFLVLSQHWTGPSGRIVAFTG